MGDARMDWVMGTERDEEAPNLVFIPGTTHQLGPSARLYDTLVVRVLFQRGSDSQLWSLVPPWRSQPPPLGSQPSLSSKQ